MRETVQNWKTGICRCVHAHTNRHGTLPFPLPIGLEAETEMRSGCRSGEGWRLRGGEETSWKLIAKCLACADDIW